ncbi:MAG: SNF2-related protein [Bacteroidales bacterium]|nr:SNF2-related protein [Bacteroidales bacterium]
MQSDHFITNTGEKSLGKTLNNILPKTETLDFLVGYFYFSGIEQLRDNIADKKMRILVGMDMDKKFLGKLTDVDFEVRKQRSSKQAIRKEFMESLTEIINTTDLLETDKTEETFNIYYKKIKDGTLEIRKTKDPHHAKMYIFSFKESETENGDTLGRVITGSSNLTYSGLEGQNEINVQFYRNTEYKDAKSIFETLWDDAVVIADKDHINEFEDGVIKHIWLEKLPSPYLLYIRCLYEYFHIDTSKRIRTPRDITKDRFSNLKYQIDAVRLAISTIEKHNGVIVSDVVGLGKSIIGSAVANNLNLKTIVIAPPHLVPQWKDYMNDFRVSYSEVLSRGNIEKALEYYREKSDDGDKWLIIIDEAHNYRNEFTQDYGMLHELCQGNKVILLTATPFNNQPADIYSLLKLFQIPTKSTLQTCNNLGLEFRDLISKYKTLKKDQKDKKLTDSEVEHEIKKISDRIRGIIQPLIIRRSRLDLRSIPEYDKDIKEQGVDFSEVDDPQLVDYALGDLSDLYISTLQRISPKSDMSAYVEYLDTEEDEIDTFKDDEDLPENTFKAARYKPITYVPEKHFEAVIKEIEDTNLDFNLFRGASRNLASFMRTLLVRRFESSQYAFKISLENILNHCINVKKWIAKRDAVPIYKKGFLPDIQQMYDNNSDTFLSADEMMEAEVAKLQTKGLFELKTKYLTDDFFTDLDSDIKLLQELKDEWDKVTNDPKADEFRKILKKQLKNDPNRKIVVFSQFADTVASLKEKLDGLPVFAYTSGDSTPANKNTIRENFDAGLDEKRQKDDYQILIATDAISEGYNLHRAGAIFNYDIPYNPTRVIQRIGRINRINKKMFEKLYIYNYFPSELGESEIRVKEITTLKMAMIHAIMGEDTKILTKDEELKNFFAQQYKDLIANDEKKSWDTDFRTELHSLVDREIMKEALSLPLRSKVRRRTSLEQEGVLVFSKFGNDFVFKMSDPNGKAEDITPEKAFNYLKADKEEKGLEVSKDFNKIYDVVKNSLFEPDNKSETDKIKREALDKIRKIIQEKSCPMGFLEDLKTAIEYDAVSGYALRSINRLKPKDYSSLTEIVSEEYIKKMLDTYDSIGRGKRTLIFAEEIESDAVVAEAGKLFK